MAQNTLAPWAEMVPDVGPMTVDELLALPEDDGWPYELVQGQLVCMPLSSGEHGIITSTLALALHSWVKPRGQGNLLAAGTGFQLGSDTVLAGDITFVRAEHVPARESATWERFWPVAPDLVVEVVSPSQTAHELEAKARAWLDAGVRLVWVVWPKRHQVDVWRPDASGAPHPTATLKRGDALDGLDVLPGFSYPLAELFA